MRHRLLVTSASILICFGLSAEAADFSSLAKAEQQHIASLIYKNECNRQADCLVSWNDGENFASLGIGHFIWFPEGLDSPFQESFPDFLAWLEHRNIALPLGLDSRSRCLWSNKDDFLAAKNQKSIAQLKQFLENSKSEQADFMMSRLQHALPKMIYVTDDKQEKEQIKQQFSRVSAAPAGWYVLADYVNFKGEGVRPSERYQHQGWGLAQVLLQMQGMTEGKAAIEDFAQAASFILERRVALSPPARGEIRWLTGWHKRLTTYVSEAEKYEMRFSE